VNIVDNEVEDIHDNNDHNDQHEENVDDPEDHNEMDEIDKDLIEEDYQDHEIIPGNQATRSGRTTIVPDRLNLFTQGHAITEYKDSTAMVIAKKSSQQHDSPRKIEE
jgi:hypothetical protein